MVHIYNERAAPTPTSVTPPSTAAAPTVPPSGPPLGAPTAAPFTPRLLRSPNPWPSPPQRRSWGGLYRPAQGRVIGGVAAASASKLGISPLAARAALVALSFVGGAGLALYIAGWLFWPAEGSNEPMARAALADHRTVALVATAAALLAALLVAASALGQSAVLGWGSPGLVSLAALVAVWRHAGAADHVAVRKVAGMLIGAAPGSVPTRARLAGAAVRLIAGAGLIAVCTSTLLAPRHLNRADIVVAFAAVGVIAGVFLLLAPWWLRLGRELAAERRQRARAEERTEMAAHLHDSVLQTLALIQRAAGDPHQVQRLARAQERELRAWLFPPSGPSPSADGPSRLSGALDALQQDVEADHGVRVEVVMVGDAPLDERLKAMVAAAREAVVNAAKWSGAESVSVYAEVEEDAVSIFVRDRGRGFDPGAVPADRKGISESVHGRVRRHGGTSLVRSAPGEGTEVAVILPRQSVP